MKPDFSGYATKAGLRCSDGRTIMPDAFKHQDTMTVPLVWQHSHNNPENVLGHAVLENRPDGVYTYAFFNDTPNGKNAKLLVEHKDITMMSIYANQLVEKAKQVFHGVIREVSLVMSGANPGALIDNITIAHSDGDNEILDDEAVIYTGLELQHEDLPTEKTEEPPVVEEPEVVVEKTEEPPVVEEPEVEPEVVADPAVEHAAATDPSDETAQDVYDTLNAEQKDLVHYMIGAALEAADDNSTQHSDMEGNGDMRRNVFESTDPATGVTSTQSSLSHDDMKGIVASAGRSGSLKAAVEEYALQHGIDDIDLLFPDAKNIDQLPEWQSRRTEWVAGVLNGTQHTPFSRIKTRSADITFEDARAKGYIKGNLKKEEFFGLTSRTTSPTTIYKKQKLDRDDIVDITDFDVVIWMKGEMRLMLEEEVARAVLIGDGRASMDDDKVKDPAGDRDGTGIRSIINDSELYVTQVHVNVDDSNSSYVEVIEAVARARRYFKGTGVPTFYTNAITHTEMLLTKDTLGRRLYNSDADLAAALRVSAIVDVEVMEDNANLLGIIVNLADYSIGTDSGGETTMFDDFDIDYNKYTYLIETRLSGALTKIKSAMVVWRQASGDVLIPTVNAPTFNPATGVVTIVATTNVVYKDGAGNTLSTGAQTALAPGAIMEVVATPTSGHFLADSDTFVWDFQRDRT